MKTSRFRGLARFARGFGSDLDLEDPAIVLVAGDDPKPGDGEDDGEGEGEEEEQPEEQPNEPAAPAADPPAEAAAQPSLDQPSFEAGAKAERERHQAVFKSEHFAGREAQATKLLANDKLSAEEITALLADTPKSGGADMLAGMGGNNPDIGAGSGTDSDTTADAKATWGRSFESLGWN